MSAIAVAISAAYLVVGTVAGVLVRTYGLNRNAQTVVCVEPAYTNEMRRQAAAGRRWMWGAIATWVGAGVVAAALVADRGDQFVTIALSALAATAAAWMVSLVWQRRTQLSTALVYVITGTGVVAVVGATLAATASVGA